MLNQSEQWAEGYEQGKYDQLLKEGENFDHIIAQVKEKNIESMAKFIYSTFEYNELGKKPEWTEKGNSLKQDAARTIAREVLKD